MSNYHLKEYWKVLDSIQDPLQVLNTHLQIVYANQQMIEQIQKFSPTTQQVIGQPLFDLCPFIPEEVREEYRTVFETGKPIHTEESTPLQGEIYHTETTKSPIFQEKKVAYVLTVIRDTTRQQKAQERLNRYAQELELRNFELESVYEYLDREIEKAMKLHQRSLPRTFPQSDSVFLAAHYQPAEKMGGDFYDTIKKGQLLITYLLDVTGHGLESALLSSFVRDMINCYVVFTPEKEVTAAGILMFLYEQYSQEYFPYEYFVCIYITVLDLGSLELEYLGAGFQDLPIVSSAKERIELNNSGLPISSVFTRDLLNFTAKKIQLKPFSTLLLNTDGITEHMVGDTPYGKRLKDVFFKNANHSPAYIVESIKEDFHRFNQDSHPVRDDITFLVMKVGNH